MPRTKSYKGGYRYGDVERSFLRVFRLDERQRGAFRGRLKHFQRLDLPGLEPGKGKKIEYTRELIFQWLIALLLAQLGIDPVLIVATIKSQWAKVLAPAIKDAIGSQAAQERKHVYLVLRPRLMSDALGGATGLEIKTFRRFDTIDNSDNLAVEADKEIAGGVRTWFCTIDLTRFAMQLDVMLPEES